MTNCCSSLELTSTLPKKHICPVNGHQYFNVAITTIMHHINDPWNWQYSDQGYYYCTDPECNVVYFGQDNCSCFTSNPLNPVKC